MHCPRRHVRPEIPTKSHERRQSRFDRELYRGRNAVERLVYRLKQFRRIATSYAKLDAILMLL
jgi:transposase